MDLPTVKAKVKAWERNFRATHKRDPTKQDIKQDASDIAELYSTYRRLSKAQSKGKESKPQPSSTTAAPSVPASTPHVPSAAAPSTPTPATRRLSAPVRVPPSSATLSRTLDDSSKAGPSQRPAPVTPQKGRQLFSTPKKPTPYSGPVQDPLPNPFSVTPRKNKMGGPAFESPFMHATSPRKLKELIDSHTKVGRARAAAESARAAAEITPRTKARKRLAGEEIDFTPAKVPRRRRGDRSGGAEPILGASQRTMSDSEDEFDMTPIKPGSAVFALMDDHRPPNPKGNGAVRKGKGPNDLFPIFQRAKRAADPTENGRAKRRTVAAQVDEEEADGPGSPTPTPTSAIGDPLEAVFEDHSSVPLVPQSPSRRTSRTARSHVLTLSDDEWDPEADTRTIRVVGTRRTVIRLAPDAGLASDDDVGGDDNIRGEDEDDAEVEDSEEDLSSGASTVPMLSYLSLRSPVARLGERLADLRVRALLDPTSAAAAALRAARRGQDVFVCGEVDGEGDEWDMQVEEVQAEGDDDWESDAEGWKATPTEEDW